MRAAKSTRQRPRPGVRSRPVERIGPGWREIFAVDLRSLALFRMGLGLCVLVDLAMRAPDLVGLYGDAGAHARSAVGLAALPNGACIEIEMILEVED